METKRLAMEISPFSWLPNDVIAHMGSLVNKETLLLLRLLCKRTHDLLHFEKMKINRPIYPSTDHIKKTKLYHHITSLTIELVWSTSYRNMVKFIQKCKKLKTLDLRVNNDRWGMSTIFKTMNRLIDAVPTNDLEVLRLQNLILTEEKGCSHEKLVELTQRFKGLQLLEINFKHAICEKDLNHPFMNHKFIDAKCLNHIKKIKMDFKWCSVDIDEHPKISRIFDSVSFDLTFYSGTNVTFVCGSRANKA